MFLTNNHNSFHWWWHENFVKHQNVAKYYDQDCSMLKLHILTLPWSVRSRRKAGKQGKSIQIKQKYQFEGL